MSIETKRILTWMRISFFIPIIPITSLIVWFYIFKTTSAFNAEFLRVIYGLLILCGSNMIIFLIFFVHAVYKEKPDNLKTEKTDIVIDKNKR